MSARQLPNSIEAEQSVLGSMMIDPRKVPVVADILSESDFFTKRHQMIYRAISELDAKNEPFDAVTLADWFKAQGIAELTGGWQYIVGLANNTPTASNAETYARIVRSKSLLRQTLDIADRIAGSAWEPDAHPQAIADGAIRDMMMIGRTSQSYEITIREACGQVIKDMQETFDRNGQLPGITTGIKQLDEKLGGFQKGDLILIPARPSMGKTSYLGYAVARAGKAGKRCGLISGEQPGKQIAARLMSAAARVDASKFRSAAMDDVEWSKVFSSSPDVAALPLWMYDRSAPTMREVIRTARRWKMEHDIDALYIDYAQRVTGEGKDRYTQVSDVARSMKTLARELDIPVIALAQVNRSVEQRTDKRPGMGDIADSGELEKEADQVVILYRDEYYHQDTPDKGVAEFIVEKNRHGPTGIIKTGWNERFMDFFDLAFGNERAAIERYEHSWSPHNG
jgi:replicative DNA helicase